MRENSRSKTLFAAVIAALGFTLLPAWAQPATGTVWAWGDNSHLQLGNNNGPDSSVPVQVPLSGVTTVAGGKWHSLALKSDGTVWAWGDNQEGELGNGVISSPTEVPVQVLAPDGVATLTGVTAVAGGGFQAGLRSYALKSDGTVLAWGSNAFGALGNFDNCIISRSAVPLQVSGLTGVTALGGGGSGHALALKSDGAVWAWGDNSAGQLGNGGGGGGCVPVQAQISNAVAAAAGGHHSLAVISDGTVWAWGDNSAGQLGNGTAGGYISVPVQVLVSTSPRTPLVGVVAVAGGAFHSLAVKSDGTVWAWGTINNSTSPVAVQVSGLADVIAVAAGDGFSTALRKNGTVWSDGFFDLSSLTGAIGVGSGAFHGLAVASRSDMSSTMTCTSNCSNPLTGSVVCYSIAVTNNGPDSAPNAGYTDTFPAELGGGAASDSVPTLASGVSTIFSGLCRQIQNTVPDQRVITNTATAVSSNPDPNSGNNSASVSVTASNPPPVLTCPADRTATATSASGAVVSYPAPGVTDNTPANLVTVSCAPPSGSTFPIGTTTVNCTGTDPGGAAGQCSFKVTVTTANLDITKTASAATVRSGANLTYTITVHNGGPGAATALTIADPLPTGVTLAGIAPGPFQCKIPPLGSSGTVTCQKPIMKDKEVATFSLTVNVTAAAGSTISNTASVKSGTFDPNQANNSATVTTRVVGPPK